jgi:hypothetical protein
MTLLFVLSGSENASVDCYPWLYQYSTDDTIAVRISPPDGYERIITTPGTFENWLQQLPLRGVDTPVRLFDGGKKYNQSAHFAVVDIDVGRRDLQQCADAVIRLRAEYLYSIGDYEKIHFNFTSGDRADFTKWTEGYRPSVNGNKVTWIMTDQKDSSYASFRKYLTRVFIYAGSYSLSKEMQGIYNVRDMQIGDVFIKGGFPGHAVIVVDMAVNENGDKTFLIAQSYMPAQDIHILRNLHDSGLDPWYDLDFGEKLYTPEWTFSRDQLMRFNEGVNGHGN